METLVSKPKIDRDDMPKHVSKALLDTIFVAVVDGEDGDAYRLTYDSQVDAVQNNNKAGTLIAAYKLVSVERIALKQTTKVVKVKS